MARTFGTSGASGVKSPASPGSVGFAWRRWLLGGLGLVTALSAAWAAWPWLGILDFQLAGSGRRAVEVLRNLESLDRARLALARDALFIASYVVLALAASLIASPRLVRSEQALRVLAWVATLGAPLADIGENMLSLRLIERVARLQQNAVSVQGQLPDPADVDGGAKGLTSAAQELGDEVDALAQAMLTFALAKWILFALLVAWAVSLLRQPLCPPHRPGSGGPEVRFPPARTRERCVAPGSDPDRWLPTPGRTGISCSGGGVRSASFCLGALQALDDHGELAKARYVTAVSGGSYLAAALAVAEWTGSWAGDPEFPPDHPDVAVDPATDRAPYAPGSPEESWFRRNSSYLGSNAGELCAGVARMVLGMGFNLLLLWLVIFAAARPLGWVMSSAAVHPELRAREPSVRIVAQPEVARPLDEALVVDNVRPVDDRTAEFGFLVRIDRPGQLQLWRPTLGASTEKEIRPVELDAVAGTGIVSNGRITILRQSRVVVGAARQVPPEINADPLQPTLQVDRQPRVAVTGGVAMSPAAGLAERIADALRVEDVPHLRQVSGTTGRPSVTFDGTDRVVGLVLLIAATLLYLAKILARSAKGSVNRAFDVALVVLGVGGVLLALVFLVLPWAVQEIPSLLSGLAGRLPGVSTPPPGADRDTGSVLTILFGALGLSASSIILAVSRQFRRRPLLVVKVLSVVTLSGLAFVTLTSLVQMSAANGPTGRLTGLGLGSTVRWYPDYLKGFSVLVVLLGLALVADAHSWSVFPFYKRRLSRAFFLHRREDGKAEPLPYEVATTFLRPEVAGHTQARIRPARSPHAPPGPELVVCASANTVDEGVAAAGRRAVTFTFSASEVGGPELGYVPTEEYLERLSPRRQRDVTVASAVAISGAAVSPAMGKASLGPVGRLLAALNVRLGVWLPNPCWVLAMAQGQRWTGRPGWPYFFRELLGQFRIDHRYVYVSDGGHWENLGLVELMRRGCTRIYCISAAGDGTTSFATIGEALALAREELGVEVDIELEYLRAPEDPPPAPGASGPEAGEAPLRRRLLRDGKPVPLARRAWARGTFTYPPDPSTPGAEPVEGTLWIVEANLTGGLPWDVQAHAERSEHFPDDPTGDQLFNHRKFESYRQLGYFQLQAIFEEGGQRPGPGSISHRRKEDASGSVDTSDKDA